MAKVRVAIVGASGYAGEELIRLLTVHPNVDLRIITSRQNAGKEISEIFPRFFGMDLKFSAPDVARIAAECDAAFLALPHGLASEYAIPLMEAGPSSAFCVKTTGKEAVVVSPPLYLL